ncbi:MAG: hypothetical protein QE278_10705 [Limnobacter sp.]|nr:hypothetical protein [Limnobacter sp.]
MTNLPGNLFQSGLLSLILAVVLIPTKSNSEDLGRIYQSDQQPNPKCENFQGHSIGKNPDLNLDIATCDGRTEVWLSRWSDTAANRGWTIVDHLRIGTFDANSEYAVTFSPICVLAKTEQRVHWVAVFNTKVKGKYTHKNGGIVQAWAINLQTSRFELASKKLLAQVVCLDEEG